MTPSASRARRRMVSGALSGAQMSSAFCDSRFAPAGAIEIDDKDAVHQTEARF
jgi:hypothetical protein